MPLVHLDLEPWEVIGLSPLKHWCARCLRMHLFVLDESNWQWYGIKCRKPLLMQQLIIEGVLNESKWRGIGANQ